MATKTFKIGLSNTDKQNMAQDVYERLLALTFPEYDTDTTYSVGDFVVYNDQLYKCIGATSGAWDSTKWQLATLNDLVTDIEDAVQFVNDKANVDGNYPTMTVGLAQGIVSDRVIEDQDVACPPITFGTTGGDAEVQSGINKFTELRGNSVVWNQLADYPTLAAPSGVTITKNNDGTYTLNGTATENKYMYLFSIPQSCVGHKCISPIVALGGTGSLLIKNGNTASNIQNLIITVASTFPVDPYVVNGTVFNNYKVMLPFFDLTQMFGAGNEPTDVNDIRVQWAIAQATKNPAYNAGELLSSQSTSLISRMRNQWDEEWEVGGIDDTTGENISVAGQFRSKNFIRVIPNTDYFFKASANLWAYAYDINKNFIGRIVSQSQNNIENTVQKVPSNCSYIKIKVFGTTYNHDICIYINYDTPNLPYVAYQQQVVELPNIELRSAGAAHDVLFASGSGKRRIGVVDLSTLTWAKENNHFYSNPLTIKQPSNNNVVANILCDKYVADTANNVNNEIATNIIGITTGSRVYLYNANITQSSDISGTLYYELATETEIDNPGWSENLETDNYGTLEFTSNQTLQVPQAYYVEYTVNLAEWVDTGYVRTGGDANDIALNSELNAKFEAYLKSLSGYDASATQQLKNISGTLTWVTEE